MSGGLVSLLDDVATLAKVAAASIDDVGVAASRAGVKAAGVLVDDAAVTPQYVHNFTADRELPMIKRIALGSVRNKLLFILPAALLLSIFLPWLLNPLLMLGGTYLSYEGAEKIWEKLGIGHHDAEPGHSAEQPLHVAADEDAMVGSAIRTDFILSSEIMVIALNEVTNERLTTRAATLFLVAIGITVLVYGVVGVIVKVDDVGLYMTEKDSGLAKTVGRGLVRGMPKFLSVLSAVGVAAMLWVGGHILLVGFDELGWHWPYNQVHHWEVSVADTTSDLQSSISGVASWLTNTLASAAVGFVVGSIVVAILHVIPRKGTSAAH